VLDENDSIIVPTTSNAAAALLTADGGNTIIKISHSGTTDVNLKHGQKLVFIDLPIGTSFRVNEAAAPGYTPAVALLVNGASAYTASGTLNTALSTDDPGAPATLRLIGLSANSAAYTNTNDTVAPTGIDLNTIPYIGLIVLALGALTAYVMVRSRRRKSHSC
jgi:hypothetical protein